MLTLGFSTLVLTRQSGIGLLPIVFLYYVVNKLLFAAERDMMGGWQMAATLLIPVVLWYAFVVFAKSFSDSFYTVATSGKQSYASMDLFPLLQIFGNASGEERALPYQILEQFTDALLKKKVVSLFSASYAAILVCSVGATFAVARAAGEERAKRITLAGVFILLFGVFYAAMIYILYIVAFPPSRALVLGSYERYMWTAVLAMLLAVVFIFYDSKIFAKYRSIYYMTLAAAALYLAFPPQVVSLNFSIQARNDSEAAKAAMRDETTARMLFAALPGDSGVCVFSSGREETYALRRLAFYIHPKAMQGIISRNHGEGESEKFLKCLSKYDYFYIDLLDIYFLAKHAYMFKNLALLQSDTLFKVRHEEDGVRLEEKLYENPRKGSKQKPLELAVRAGLLDIVRVLLEHGADVRSVDKDGNTALASAAAKGHTDIARLLLDSGADVNAVYARGWSPLMHAARHGHEELARLLLARGANAKAKTRGKKGATALQIAEQRGHAGIAQMMRVVADQKASTDAAPLEQGEARD